MIVKVLGSWLFTWTSVCIVAATKPGKAPLPLFRDLKAHYPGYHHHGGKYNNHHLIDLIGCAENRNLLLHDTSALRLSYALNEIGEVHSLGKLLIRLSTHGRDSVEGKNGFQYIYMPIAFGPYLADKYDYPLISKVHSKDPIATKKNFWGKQGILRVITYTKTGNQPKGHVALWDCNHFHQSKDWIAGHTLITVEFWESPDSDCSSMDPSYSLPSTSIAGKPSLQKLIQNSEAARQKFIKSHTLPSSARHRGHKLRNMGLSQL